MGLHLLGAHNAATPTSSRSHTNSPWLFSALSLFTDRPGLFNYRFSTQSLLTGCISDRMLARRQTADRVQKSLQIIFNLLHWPKVQNIHLHWASLKSALTASKHWTPSTASSVNISEQYSPQSIQLHTRTHTLTYAYGRAVHRGWYTIILQTDSIWQQAVVSRLVLQTAADL